MQKRNRSMNYKDFRYVSSGSRNVVKTKDLTKRDNICFHCGEVCRIKDGMIQGHPNRYWELCWASNRPAPPFSTRTRAKYDNLCR